jgi:hypothetical protein
LRFPLCIQVIIATPLEFTDLSLSLGAEEVTGGGTPTLEVGEARMCSCSRTDANVRLCAQDLPAAAGKKRPYQTTHATLVQCTSFQLSSARDKCSSFSDHSEPLPGRGI